MATLQRIGDTFHIRFRFAGKPYRRSLLVSEEAEALATRNQVELTLHRVTTGTIPPPPPGADVPTYFISGGKQDGKPALAPQVIPTLKEMWESYLTSLPTGAKEESSLNTEKYQFKHLLRILGATTRVVDITTDSLQEYIKERSRQRGFRGNIKPRTIRKEISTFRNVWNNFAVPRQIVVKNFRAAFGKLLYPKESERPSFQTWEQIERQVARGGLSKNEIASLWDCLFLDLGRIRQFLDHVRQKPGLPGWVYPALVAVAHTGCRRGEFLRSQISDWEIEHGEAMPTVKWREKKKDRTKQFTFRPVSVTPMLLEVMTKWFAHHPGGQYAFCDDQKNPITKKESLYWFDAATAGSWSVLRGWHVFRHSFVSCLAMKGVDQRIIDASVGHQTEEMRKRYRHLFPHKQHEVLAAVFSAGE